MAETILSYARPGTGQPPLALPAVFPGTNRPTGIFLTAVGVVTAVPALFLHLGFGIAMLVSAGLVLLGMLGNRVDRDYLVLDVDHVTVNGARIPRNLIGACERGLNGYKLRLIGGGSARISLLEIQRKDVRRLEHALTEYCGRISSGEAGKNTRR